MLKDSTAGKGRWLLNAVVPGETSRFSYPTGVGGTHVIVAMAERWAEIHGGPVIVISAHPQLAAQWAKMGLSAITRFQALREIDRKGTILGHLPSSIGLTVLEEPEYGIPSHVQRFRDMLKGCTVIETSSGAVSDMDTWTDGAMAPASLACIDAARTQ